MNTRKPRHAQHFYEFGAFRLDPRERIFARAGERIPLAPKAFDTLLFLVQHSGRVLTKEELIAALWPDSFVEENNLTQHISALRRALASSPSTAFGSASDLPEQGYIETVPKLGYRFVGDVREIAEGDGELSEPEEIIISKRTRTRIVVREEVEEEEDNPDSSTSSVAAAAIDRSPIVITQTQPMGKPRLHRGTWAALAGTVVVAAGMVTWIEIRNHEPRSGSVGDLARLTSDSGLTMSPALSPDGRLVAYASDRGGKGDLDIWLQPVSGGEALQLTHDAKDDSSPTFSPDGRGIAFRSERDGGGIYIVSVKGGEARLLAPDGRRPKYSPDGQWIAYWTGTETEDNTGAFMVPGAGNIYVLPASGGTARELVPEFAAAGYPVWAPDSRHILFLGNRDSNVYHEGTTDWWVTSIDGGETIGTGASATFRKMGFASASQAPESWASDGSGVLMSATLSDTRNIWRVPISQKDWKISAEPQRLTFGTGSDMQPSVVGDALVFAGLTERLDVWTLPMETNRPRLSDNPKQLTSDASRHTYPAISPDGSKLAFSLQRAGDRDIWMKDLHSGKESAISIPPGPSFNPNFSPDGNTLTYRTVENRISIGYAVSVANGGTQKICDNCSDYGWSSDQKRVVLVGTTPARISILDVATKQRTPLLDDPEYLLWNARFSPDDKWISFNATSQGRSKIFVVPVREEGLVPRKDWIAIADSGWDDKPRWSPDGSTIYFLSERDGFRCVWVQRLDRGKRPSGAAIAIFHAHESQRSFSHVGPGDLSLSVARDKIVFNMSERVGNVWMTSLGRR